MVFDVFDSMASEQKAQTERTQTADDAFIDDKTRFLDTSEHRELIQEATDKNKSEDAPQTKLSERQGFLSKLLKKIFG